jgi:hypothetical protein
MNAWKKLVAIPGIVALVGAAAPPASADDDDNKRSNVGASFGRGLNTAQPGNAVNHAILPREIKVKEGGVVNFTVAGLHDIIVFKPGVKLDDLKDPATGQFPSFGPGGTFVFEPNLTIPLPPAITPLVYYRGINPAGGPLATAFAGNPANSSNRTEAVAFLEKGTYLVIRNIRPHLLDGMYAYAKVSD